MVVAILLPMVSAPAMAGEDIRLLCAPTGQMSVDAAAAINEVRALIGLPPLDVPPPSEHCEDCLPIAALKTAQPYSLFESQIIEAALYPSALPSGFHYHPQGPPLGSRAPPLTV